MNMLSQQCIEITAVLSVTPTTTCLLVYMHALTSGAEVDPPHGRGHRSSLSSSQWPALQALSQEAREGVLAQGHPRQCRCVCMYV